MHNPIGFSMREEPAFHWIVEDAKGTKAKESRIIVWKAPLRTLSALPDFPAFSEADGKKNDACGESGLTLAADTGWADLDSLAAAVPLKLSPRTRYFWKVFVRTDAGEEGESSVQFFETGKRDEPWTAKWIALPDESTQKRHPVFSKKIAADGKEIAAARLYISAAGLFEAFWNGQKIGDEFLTPYCTNYNAWVEAITFDITEEVCKSAAAGEAGTLSVMLGNGWFNGRFGFNQDRKPHFEGGKRLTAEVHITYTDGTEAVIGTDESWDVTLSNITFSNIYDGEQRDDTLPEVPAVKAVIAAPPKGKLMDRLSLPVRVKHVLTPVALISTPAGETVLDLGQNQAGIWRLALDVPAGTKVHLQVGEVLQNGNFYNDNLRTAKAEYIYVSNGKKITLEPHFTFYGYRYVKIEGVPGLKKEDFEGLSLYSDMDQTGTMETGDAKVNRLIQNAEWGKRSNFIDVPTDCPQRDERMGWTGDAEVFSPTALYQSDAYAFYVKYLYDMATEQKERDGCVPDVVPSFDVNSAACAWGDATTIIPWNMYLYSGDSEILVQHYEAMKSWVDYIEKLDEDNWGWRRHFHYGDWLALDGDSSVDAVLGGTDEGFIAEVYKLYSMRIAADAAKVLSGRQKEEEAAADRMSSSAGRTGVNSENHPECADTAGTETLDYAAEARKYEALAAKTLQDIREEYYSLNGRCCIDTQTAMLLSLRFGLATDPDRIADRLAELLTKNGGRLKTGFIGTPILCEELSRIGKNNMAYDLLFNEEYPGWLYEVNLGATTIWERWNSMLPDGSVSSTGMNSFNHYSYGAITTWLYERVGGLMRDPQEPGFRRIIFAPNPSLRLGSAAVSYRSAAGLYQTYWKVVDDNTMTVKLSVPFGCEADVKLPYFDAENVPEDLAGNAILNGLDAKTGISHVGPGNYEITYTTQSPMARIYSTRDRVKDLLAEPAVRKVLDDIFPDVENIPAHMSASPLRGIAGIQGVTDSVLDAIDEKLSKVKVSC